MKHTYVCGDTHGKDIICPDDCSMLIHLGDWERGGIDGCFPAVLIRGNHDPEKNREFDFTVDGMAIGKYYFSHEPMERLPKGTYINIHGHLHGNKYSDYGYEQKEFHREILPNQFYKLEDIK